MLCPKTDFYQYCNSEWLGKTEIPAGYSRWGRFNELDDLNLQRLKDLLETNDNPMIKQLLNGFVNFQEEKETQVINVLLEEINKTENIEDLIKLYINKLNKYGFNVLYDMGKETDFKNSDKTTLYLSPASLFLPNRSYYLEDSFEDKREELKKYLSQLVSKFNLTIDVNEILNLEIELAKLHYLPEELRDPLKIYHPRTIDLIPKVYQLNLFFESLNKTPELIINCNPEYFERVNLLLDNDNLDLFKNYFKLKIINRLALVGQGSLYDLSFDFYGRKIQGKKDKLPLWKREVNLVNGLLGEMFGQEYVEKYFSNEDKMEVMKMITFLLKVLDNFIKKNTWMTEKTKERALDKLNKMSFKIGYPNKWNKFVGLSISDLSSHYERVMRISEWWFYDDNKDLYQSVDKEKWHMLPQTVNAYYDPTKNEIVFPAGILQPPFFHRTLQTPAQNFGGIGVVIAHEITHGFDDEGKKFDGDGNLNEWWEKEDEEEFMKEANKLVEQFNNLTFFETNLNGKLTLGENLADLGGVLIALEGLKQYLPKIRKEDYQEFFESYGRLWATLIEKDEAIRLIKIDPHSPGYYRVNGILSHVDEFYNTYEITEENKMYLREKDRCKIWRF
jgi:putative endopeptidase